MDYRKERFDHFGFESPFASGEGEASGVGVGVEAEVMFAPDTGFFERPWEQEREAQSDALKLTEMLAIPGRFDDPKRNPATEKDGTRFDVFLKDGNRAAFVQKWLAACPQLAQAAAEPHGDLKTSDIATPKNTKLIVERASKRGINTEVDVTIHLRKDDGSTLAVRKRTFALSDGLKLHPPLRKLAVGKKYTFPTDISGPDAIE